jgi:hypothetical protein
MAFIEDSAPQKKCNQTIKHENFLRHWLLQTPGEKSQREEKR